MWIRKTNDEIDNKNNNEEYFFGIKLTIIKISVFIFFFVFIFTMAFELIFGESKGRFYLPQEYSREKITWSDIPGKLPEYFTFASVSGILLYILARKFKNYKTSGNTYICQKCNKVKANDGINKCECGGEYIQIDKMKWVEDDNGDNNLNN